MKIYSHNCPQTYKYSKHKINNIERKQIELKKYNKFQNQ